MIKSFYRLLSIKMIIVLILLLLCSPTLCGKNTYTMCLVYSHYIPIYLNNIYLLTIYQFIYRLNTLSPYLITRIGENKFYIFSYIVILSISIIYTFIIYISYYFFFGSIPVDSMSVTVLFMVLNLIVICIESTIIYMQLGHQRKFIYLALPILINLAFHFIFTNIF